MGKCEWCGKTTDNLIMHTDALGNNHIICAGCNETVQNCECRKCGSIVDPNMMINGLCTTCVQAELKLKSKKQEEVRMGVDRDSMNIITSELELTEADYERWMLMSKSFSPSDMKNSKELRRLWIMVKINASGVYDSNVISDSIGDIELLLDRNFSKLIGNKCKLIIGSTPETRKIIRESSVIDYENAVYIIEA